ncbi:MAG TPA: aminotransferase class V-fold PLP-dependent enzyme, partial [Deinococcales bacterium]|nr:aminotransferase class V-fold PLP-dependent enzyme [Deinococcales bacterium]
MPPSVPAQEAALLAARAEFPILGNSVYFAAHTLGPVGRESLEALQAYGEAWATRGVRAWGDGWWALPERVGNAIGALMNAPAGSVTTTSHATESLAAVLAALDFSGPRHGLVTTSLEFPSLLYQAKAWERHGARVTVTPPRPDDPLTPDLDALLAAIDETTRLVSVCHVYFRNSYLLDVARVVEKAHAAGALVCLDAYQSLGTVPLDVQALGVDFTIGGSVKWVLGGPGVGYLYARPGLPEDLPGLRGWSGHADPFGFEEDWRPGTGARRFATGTPNVPALAAALPGYELVARLGVPAIRAKS